jgi:hypothetical protein
VYVSVATIYNILRRHHVPRVSFKRYRPGPRRRRELTVPGQSVQVDAKHPKLGGRRFYKFTAIDVPPDRGLPGGAGAALLAVVHHRTDDVAVRRDRGLVERVKDPRVADDALTPVSPIQTPALFGG